MSKRILITGAAGYLGRLLGTQLRQKFEVIGTDIRPDDSLNFPIQIADIREPGMDELLRKHAITHVIHLASVIDSSDDPLRDYAIDVEGTRNVLDACLDAGVQHITIASSGAAYGYHADNPAWIDESDAIRGNDEFSYSKHKRIVEEMLATYRDRNPELGQLVFRPGTILGASTGNLITELFQRPRLLAIRGSDSPFVFIWDHDVVQAMVQGVENDQVGIFNMAGDGALTIHEIADILGKPVLEIPAAALRTALRIGKALRVARYGPDQVKFLQYRPVLSNRRLKGEFGYTPEKTSRETFLYYLEHARQRGEM